MDIKTKEKVKPLPKPIVTVFGSESEKAAMQKIKNVTAGDRSLSWSDFILEHFGIRKAEVKK